MSGRVCSVCGADAGFLKLTWVKLLDLFFCSECYGVYEEYIIAERLNILKSVRNLKVIISCNANANNIAIPNKDATEE